MCFKNDQNNLIENAEEIRIKYKAQQTFELHCFYGVCTVFTITVGLYLIWRFLEKEVKKEKQRNRELALVSLKTRRNLSSKTDHIVEIQAGLFNIISPIHTFVYIPAQLLENTLRFLIRAGIFTKV